MVGARHSAATTLLALVELADLAPEPIRESTRALALLTRPEPGYFAVGARSYGCAPTFLMASGYEQVRSVVAALAGDWDAARGVQLELPETGLLGHPRSPGHRPADMSRPATVPSLTYALARWC